MRLNNYPPGTTVRDVSAAAEQRYGPADDRPAWQRHREREAVKSRDAEVEREEPERFDGLS